MVIPDFMFKYYIFVCYTKSKTVFHIDRRTSDSGFSVITSYLQPDDRIFCIYVCIYCEIHSTLRNYFEIFRRKKKTKKKKNHTHSYVSLFIKLMRRLQINFIWKNNVDLSILMCLVIVSELRLEQSDNKHISIEKRNRV